jgi:ribosome maturation protein SDO1
VNEYIIILTMSRINQPINQVRLTNVAVVKYHYKGKRFEVACYKNKIVDYRAGLETDLSEVLQSERIFVNVGKGEFANSTDLQRIFGTKDEIRIAKIILEKGNSVHVSDLERNQLLEQTIQKIAVWLSENCIHPGTGRPYTVHQMKHALGNYPIQPQKAIKKQYLDAFKFIKTTKRSSYPIERCKMELSFIYPIIV